MQRLCYPLASGIGTISSPIHWTIRQVGSAHIRARCMSNALQQLHHSFNFYFFTGPNSHISNGTGPQSANLRVSGALRHALSVQALPLSSLCHAPAPHQFPGDRSNSPGCDHVTSLFVEAKLLYPEGPRRLTATFGLCSWVWVSSPPSLACAQTPAHTSGQPLQLPALPGNHMLPQVSGSVMFALAMNDEMVVQRPSQFLWESSARVSD